MEILIGTKNKNKFRQFKWILNGLDKRIKVYSLESLGIIDDVEEDSDDLLDNAKKKVKYYGEKTGMITLSDDTGLFIDALNGEPGVHSRRWLCGTDKDRYTNIFERMKGIPENKRTSRYIGVLALYNPDKKEFWSYSNNVEGTIAKESSEKSGFGYDAIFISKEYNKYYSQLTEEERHRISHRGMGARELLKYIN